MGRSHCKRAAIRTVQLNIDNLKPRLRKDVLHDGQRIIFQMLLTHRVVSELAKHERQIALLEMPDTVIRKHTRDILHERYRIRQIIEHRDGCHDAGLFAGGRAIGFFVEEIDFQRNIVGIEAAEFLGARINANAFYTRRFIGLEGCRIICANI